MTPEAQRQKAIEVARKAAQFHWDWQGSSPSGIAECVVQGLIDAGMLCSHDLDAIEAEANAAALAHLVQIGAERNGTVTVVNAVWRAALSGSAPTRTETP